MKEIFCDIQHTTATPHHSKTRNTSQSCPHSHTITAKNQTTAAQHSHITAPHERITATPPQPHHTTTQPRTKPITAQRITAQHSTAPTPITTSRKDQTSITQHLLAAHALHGPSQHTCPSPPAHLAVDAATWTN